MDVFKVENKEEGNTGEIIINNILAAEKKKTSSRPSQTLLEGYGC